jgi:hypothetical protein
VIKQEPGLREILKHKNENIDNISLLEFVSNNIDQNKYPFVDFEPVSYGEKFSVQIDDNTNFQKYKTSKPPQSLQVDRIF